MIKVLKLLSIGLFFFLLAGCTDKNKTDFVLTEQVTVEENESEEKSDTIYVYICGEVKTPDVYQLPNGARVIDAIKAAGGLTKKADLVAVNQALLIADGDQIYIPQKTKDTSADAAKQEDSDIRVNLNTATKEQLMTLPGIGEAKANLIIADREANGKFIDIEDIKRIDGIKEGVFLKIRDLIKID